MRMLWIVGLALLLIVGMSPARAQNPIWNFAFWNNIDMVGAPVASGELTVSPDGGFSQQWTDPFAPHPGVNNDNWSVRYNTTQTFAAGRYRFIFGSEDGMRVFIDNVLVYDQWLERDYAYTQFEYDATAGQHTIRVDYFNGTGNGYATVIWTHLATNLLLNSDAQYGLQAKAWNWSFYSTPTANDVVYQMTFVNAENNVIWEFYRNPQPPGGNTAVFLQGTKIAIPSGTTLRGGVDLGNDSNVRKRATILIHDGDFSDLFVCSFWLPPNTPRQRYSFVGNTTEAWTDATFSLYAASPDGIGWYEIDNPQLVVEPIINTSRTLCIDPDVPPPPEETPEAESIF